jgi:hypothetical protein
MANMNSYEARLVPQEGTKLQISTSTEMEACISHFYSGHTDLRPSSARISILSTFYKALTMLNIIIEINYRF